jgi:hypothetical protein
MSAHPSDKYKALLNYMYNDLKITKDDIRDWTKEAVTDVAQRYVEKQMESGLVEEQVRGIIRNKKFQWWEAEDTLDEWVKKEVVERLVEGVHLKVNVVGAEKKATIPDTKLKFVTRKAKR